MEIQVSTPAAGQVIAADKPATARPGAIRLVFIDNLRWVMIMLVLSMHAAVTYSSRGGWYYKEPANLSRVEILSFVTYQAFLQSFFMGLLFFVAGYFIPGAYDKKGGVRFLKDRAYRLGLPTLLYIFILGPLTEYYISRSWDPDSADRSFLREYRGYILHGHWPGGTGPLWFCAALLIFCAGYAGWRGLSGKTGAGGGGPRPFPGKVVIGGFILIIAFLSFLVRIPWPNGTSFYNMQLGDFSQYILFFIAGTLAYRRSWLTTLSRPTGLFWGRMGLFGGLVVWITILVLGGAFSGHADDYSGGWHWQSAGLCVWESLAGTGLSIGCLLLFRERYNRQGRRAGFFSDNAFAVYVFHPPVLIAISLGMAGLHWPPLLKFVLLTLASIIVTYSISGAILRKIPLLKKIL
ncbi:MAG TPA: acyltransferase family protein [Puia sp.]|nr:acyltransferase family protein [Puia sp.]